jgi:hypothetical protein
MIPGTLSGQYSITVCPVKLAMLAGSYTHLCKVLLHKSFQWQFSWITTNYESELQGFWSLCRVRYSEN